MKTFRGKWLEKIIDGAKGKSIEGVALVRRDENCAGPAVGSEFPKEGNTAGRRHLHIEKDKIGTLLPDDLEGLAPAGRLPYDFDVTRICKELAHPKTSVGLIISNNRAKVHAVGVRSGNSISARAPSGRSMRSRRYSEPKSVPRR